MWHKSQNKGGLAPRKYSHLLLYVITHIIAPTTCEILSLFQIILESDFATRRPFGGMWDGRAGHPAQQHKTCQRVHHTKRAGRQQLIGNPWLTLCSRAGSKIFILQIEKQYSPDTQVYRDFVRRSLWNMPSHADNPSPPISPTLASFVEMSGEN